MYHRNRCIDEMTEILRQSLREAVHANASPAGRAEARRRAERAERLRRMVLAVATGLTALALLLLLWS